MTIWWHEYMSAMSVVWLRSYFGWLVNNINYTHVSIVGDGILVLFPFASYENSQTSMKSSMVNNQVDEVCYTMVSKAWCGSEQHLIDVS